RHARHDGASSCAPRPCTAFSGQLALVAVLQDLSRVGAQVVMATHSPVLAATPGATIVEVGSWGLRETGYDDLELVWHWKAFLDNPMRYLRHLDPS
ncbi:MAG: hypothetical protein WCA82_09850, partial [Jiangellales bacterium]